jgi:hypothetical protein
MKMKAVAFIFISIILTVCAAFFLGPLISDGINSHDSETMQMAHAIGISLFSYANDHNGHFPEGKTSTEVFQQLIDGKYVNKPTLFFVEMPGKAKPQSDQLKPENVCWDVTCCVDSTASDGLPLVFLTGYKVTYEPGSKAFLVHDSPKTWTQWWKGSGYTGNYMAVSYKSILSRSIRPDADGSIPNFVPTDFDPKGKTYRQLTP